MRACPCTQDNRHKLTEEKPRLPQGDGAFLGRYSVERRRSERIVVGRAGRFGILHVDVHIIAWQKAIAPTAGFQSGVNPVLTVGRRHVAK